MVKRRCFDVCKRACVSCGQSGYMAYMKHIFFQYPKSKIFTGYVCKVCLDKFGLKELYKKIGRDREKSKDEIL